MRCINFSDQGSRSCGRISSSRLFFALKETVIQKSVKDGAKLLFSIQYHVRCDCRWHYELWGHRVCKNLAVFMCLDNAKWLILLWSRVIAYRSSRQGVELDTSHGMLVSPPHKPGTTVADVLPWGSPLTLSLAWTMLWTNPRPCSPLMLCMGSVAEELTGSRRNLGVTPGSCDSTEGSLHCFLPWPHFHELVANYTRTVPPNRERWLAPR